MVFGVRCIWQRSPHRTPTRAAPSLPGQWGPRGERLGDPPCTGPSWVDGAHAIWKRSPRATRIKEDETYVFTSTV